MDVSATTNTKFVSEILEERPLVHLGHTQLGCSYIKVVSYRVYNPHVGRRSLCWR